MPLSVVEMEEETEEVKTFQRGTEVQMMAGTCTLELG
jgi:hypothetical protein